MTDKKTTTSEVAQTSHAEAPRSATVNVKSKNGFYWLFTMREETAKDLLEDMEKLEQIMMIKGWTPVEPRSGGGFPKKPELPTKPCPMLGHEPLKERIGKDGKPHWGHSRGVYPNLVWCNGFGFPGEVAPVQQAAPYNQTTGNGNIPERDINEDF